MIAFFGILKKEIRRFSSIWVQTIVGPVTTALLYQLIFGMQLNHINTGIPGVTYATYLIPGLTMMQVLLNSFGNSSSSLIQAKYNGNIIFLLMAPVSALKFYSAYVISSIIRGLVVGLSVLLTIMWFGSVCTPSHYIVLIFFVLFGSSITASLGVIAGILCSKFDQLSGFQSFVIVPLIYLAGIFFNSHALPTIWSFIARLDPFLYIIDGVRYGFIGHASYNVRFGEYFVLIFAIAVNYVGYYLISHGIKLKR